ncbi:hypothetical protein IMSAGC017_00162 [Thomasclavelia cocleata]|uniref:Holin, phage phi LC3 family n=1 Tax=Thomasclavelia cocleata TaxID=69824 RepID=A0A829Z733_9FIRM|nr:phage holin [Thomasclavelia cocleata]GFI40131.1 hypothetical protein IMSAGC017_00162 [Thomasclavelia cocleata]
MKNINLEVRLKNPVFLIQIILAVLTPVLAYAGLRAEDITTWGTLMKLLIDAFKNPYVLSLVFISVFNAINDPTTPGLKDKRLDENCN